MISIIQDDYYCYKRREFYLCGLSSHAGKRDDGVCVILEKNTWWPSVSSSHPLNALE